MTANIEQPPFLGDVIGNFLALNSHPYDEKAISEAFALSAMHTVRSIRWAIVEGAEGDHSDFSFEDLMHLLGQMEQWVRDVAARDNVRIDQYLGARP